MEDRLGFKVNRDVEVKFRRTGEGIKINNTNKSLKDFMRENKVLPWQRDRIPLIYIDKELESYMELKLLNLFICIDFLGANKVDTNLKYL